MTDRFIEARENILRKYFPTQWNAELSDKEKDVAILAARRLSGKEIAEKLHISENTVKTHMKHVYEKLDINGTVRNKRASLEHIIGYS